jgi:hypothetical protein
VFGELEDGMDTVAAALIGLGLIAPRPASPWWQPAVDVAVRPVAPMSSTVDVEIRNTTLDPLDVPIQATFRLAPVTTKEPRPSEASTLISVFDPTADTVADPPDADVRLRLPVRGIRRVRVNLMKLKWSLTPPLYVWIPRPLSQVADYPEYDLTLELWLRGMGWPSVTSKPIRIRLGR